MLLQPFDPSSRTHLSTLVSIWGAACGPDLRITSRFVEFNTQPSTGAVQAGQWAIHSSRSDSASPIGFVLASALPNDAQTSSPQAGWIDVIAVMPEYQHRGIGAELLGWAEQWLRGQECTRARLGGSLRPFVAGYPVELGKEGFFRRRGYTGRANAQIVWDVARDLSGYDPRHTPSDPRVGPAGPGDERALLDFFIREFPNRWRFEFQESLRAGGRISDWMILWTERGVDGFARLTLEDSVQPYERFYPYRLPRPWAQLGPIGISQELRGRGMGGMLLDATLVRLRDAGVRGCVIDWTDLVDFYSKFGFAPYRQYAILLKPLEAT